MSPLSLAFLLFAYPPPETGTATVEYERWHELADPDDVPAPLPAPWAATRTVDVREDAEGFEIEVLWRIDALREDWFSATLIGPGVRVRNLEVTWNGKPAAATTDGAGTRIAGLVGTRGATVVLTGRIDQRFGQRPVALELAPAVRGTVDVRPRAKDVRGELRETPAKVPARYAKAVSLPGAVATFASAKQYLELDVGRADAADDTTVSVATVATGITVGDAELRGHARVRVDVRRGAIQGASLRVSGLGADLQVTGDNLVNWTQSGDRIDLELERAIEDRLVLDLTWSKSVPKGTEASLGVPTIEVDGAFRSVQAVALAGSAEVELVPELEGIAPVPRAELEGRADGLVEGTPSATFLGQATPGGSVKLLRFVPAKQPPTFIDRANYTVATTDEGRALIRAVYQVRNERSSHLHVTPPAGMEIIGARVSGETALLARDRTAKGTYLIPLERSVETVDGLLSFPVEVTFVADETDWDRREKRTLTLPALDAPVAASRVTLHLPPRYRNKQKKGRGGTVPSFEDGEGISYGFGYGTPQAAQADELFRGAVDAWLDNDFDNAQAKLDELRSLGASDENIARLQSNVDVVTGKSSGKGKDQALVRRVKQQAQARSAEERREQQVYTRKAEEYRKSGQLKQAKEAYGSALALGKKLQNLEQSESVEGSAANALVEKKMELVDKEMGLKAKRDSGGKKAKPKKAADVTEVSSSSTTGTGGGDATVYDFSDDQIDGELVRPDGVNLDARVVETPPLAMCSGDASCGMGEICVDGTCVTGKPLAEPPPPPPAPADEALPEELANTEPEPEPEPEPQLELDEDMDMDMDIAMDMGVDEPEPMPVRDSTRGTSRRARRRDRKRRGKNARQDAAAAPEPQHRPQPKVTASALSVIVPAIGETVLYERLLLPPDEPMTIEIDAKFDPPPWRLQ